MKPENISARLRFILSLSERWERDGVIAEIDRDVILEYLRGIYSEVSASETVAAYGADARVLAAVAGVERGEADEPSAVQPESAPVAVPDLEDDDMVLDDDILSVAVDEDIEPEPFVTPEPTEEPEPEPIAESVSESIVEPVSAQKPERTAADETVPESEANAEEQSAAEPAPATEPQQEPQPEPALESAAEIQPEPAAEPSETVSRASYEVGSLFDLGGVDRSRKRSIVMSLYGDSPAPARPRPVEQPAPELVPAPAAEVQPAPVAEPEPVEPAKEESVPVPQPEAEPQSEKVAAMSVVGKPTAVLGEVIVSGVKTVADAAPRVERVAESLPVTDLHTAINLNDKFTMIRDLFGGDVESYNRTVSRLNGMRSLDEALFYIGKNFAWKAETEGARLLMDVLQRRYGR